jgi:hypothetical protein
MTELILDEGQFNQLNANSIKCGSILLTEGQRLTWMKVDLIIESIDLIGKWDVGLDLSLWLPR